MHEPRSYPADSVGPDEIMRRLQMITSRYRAGDLTSADFNTLIRPFQFQDDFGQEWAPGALSGKWYRWEQDQWVEAPAPTRLSIPQAPVLFGDRPQRASSTPPAGASPTQAGPQCPSCGAPGTGSRFCTTCGGRM
jgi:hypothetical protein